MLKIKTLANDIVLISEMGKNRLAQDSKPEKHTNFVVVVVDDDDVDDDERCLD